MRFSFLTDLNPNFSNLNKNKTLSTFYLIKWLKEQLNFYYFELEKNNYLHKNENNNFNKTIPRVFYTFFFIFKYYNICIKCSSNYDSNLLFYKNFILRALKKLSVINESHYIKLDIHGTVHNGFHWGLPNQPIKKYFLHELFFLTVFFFYYIN